MSKKVIISLLFILILPAFLIAQTGSIAGKVTDQKTGDPLPGANVSIAGTNMGAATDNHGSYTISNVPPGSYQVEVNFIGYTKMTSSVSVVVDQAASLNVNLMPEAIEVSAIVTEVNRAEYGKTPAAFTDVSAADISQNYTTQDIPDLIKHVPGVFSTASGIGEAEIYIRGLNTNHIRVEINGIVTNDPESQKVYFSNWTGLASNANHIQVQRGAGSWLYGGGFGGSLNVNTYGPPAEKALIVRSSVGFYETEGANQSANTPTGLYKGPDDGRVANGRGVLNDYTPVNYMTQLRYNTGRFGSNGQYTMSMVAERKGGNSYLDGTTYDGWSFGLELQALWNKQTVVFSFIGAPQRHNQTWDNQDMALMATLGREYNRQNHPFQENHFYKPQWSVRHFWDISNSQSLSSNVFFTMGRGGGQYLRNDSFNPATGEVTFKSVSESTDNKRFGRNARYIYEITGGAVTLEGYDADAQTFKGVSVSRGTNIISSSFSHSWLNDSQNFHEQFGLNTAYEHTLSQAVKLTVGGEARRWRAQHFADTERFRSADDQTGELIIFDKAQRRYDYTTFVTNLSGFGRLQVNPVPELTLQGQAQLQRNKQDVNENDIRIFDFEAGKFLDATFRTTEDLGIFSESDYERTYNFFSPKFGANYNRNQFNVFATWSVDHKEPRTGDWFSRSSGPGVNQPEGQDLKAEKLTNIELGIGYRNSTIALSANLYQMKFKDKIESVTDQQGERTTLNAGEATHKGIEISGMVKEGNFEANTSITLARNRWDELSVQKIFSADAEDVVDKVVPFSPEKMWNTSAGLFFMERKLRVGISTRWWDDYYGSFTNTYDLIDGTEVEAKLPTFFELNANITYRAKFGNQNVMFRVDINNLTNRSNMAKANWTRDFNRTDALGGARYMYVTPAPLRNIFVTTEIGL